MAINGTWRTDPIAHDEQARQYSEIVRLNKVLHLLSQRDQSFANSLIAQSAHTALSTRERGQLWWVRELAARGEAAQKAPPAAARTPAAAAQQFRPVAFTKLAELFLKGANHRTFVVFETAKGKFRLALADTRNGQAPSINVTSPGRSFEERTWFGRISEHGGFTASRKVAPAQLQGAIEALQLAEQDPVASIAKAGGSWGQETGQCCFCGQTLTDPRSKHVGYGPICAGNFGLPWGETPGKLSCEEVKAEQQAIVSDADIPF